MKDAAKFLLVVGILAIIAGFACGEPPQSTLVKSIIQPSVCQSGCDCGCQQTGQCDCSSKSKTVPISQAVNPVIVTENMIFVGTPIRQVQQGFTQQQYFLPANNNSWKESGFQNYSTPTIYYNRGVSAPVLYNQSRFFSAPPPRSYRSSSCPGGNCR